MVGPCVEVKTEETLTLGFRFLGRDSGLWKDFDETGLT